MFLNGFKVVRIIVYLFWVYGDRIGIIEVAKMEFLVQNSGFRVLRAAAL